MELVTRYPSPLDEGNPSRVFGIFAAHRTQIGFAKRERDRSVG